MKIEVRNGAVTIEGYVNVTERLSKPIRDVRGNFLEKVQSGAFNSALQRNNNVELRFNHRRKLGDQQDGSLELREDICVGSAASMASVLLAAGAKGKRFALPHSQVMIHQPLGGVQGQATEIEIHAREILRMRKELNGLLSKHTGQPIDVIQKDTDRDNFMTAEDAKAYGLVDEILVRPHEEAK